jgi:hypothetical protein
VDRLDKTTQRPITNIELQLSATYSYDVPNTPDKIVLRVFLNHDGGETQLTAWDQRDSLSKSDSGQTGLSAGLINHPNISNSDIDPPEGETSTLSLDIRTEFSVFRNGSVIASAQSSDSTTVEITKEGVKTASTGGSGGFEVTTATTQQ